MSAKNDGGWTTQDNHRVVVYPRLGTFSTEVTMAFDRNAIVEQIKRHVDNVASVEIESDTVCRFCGSKAEVAEKDEPDGTKKGQPLCCGKAIEFFDALEARKQ